MTHANMDSTTKDMKLQDVLLAISGDISDLYTVDVHSKETKAYKMSGDAAGITEGMKITLSYEKLMGIYIDQNVYSLDKELFRKFADFERLCNELSKKDSTIFHYRVIRDDELHYYFLKCTRIGDAEAFDHVAFSFVCEDNGVNRRMIFNSILAGAGSKKKFLLIDNHPENTRHIIEAFEDEFEIIETASVDQALTVLRKMHREISAVLMAFNIVEETDYAYFMRVRNDAVLNSIPVVILAESYNGKREELCINNGATDFLTQKESPIVIKKRLRNIAKLRESNSMLNAVETDELTGLLTRQAFYHYAKVLLEENPGEEFDLAIADIENFKLINSIYGENKGDEVLKHVADYFYRNTEGGLCARYGGDQFVGFAKADPNRKKDWILSLIDGVNENAPISNIVVKCGVYTDVDRELSISNMCDRALLAVKSIKHNYTKPYAKYDGPVSMAHLKSQMYETQFTKALENKEFVVWYQPKFDAYTEKIVGAEALVRWKMKDGMFVSPGDFIPTFEEDGLIAKLDEYVFSEVADKVKFWKEKGARVVPISVNLSRTSLYLEDTVKKYEKIIEETGLPRELVPIELTESAAIDSKYIKELMTDLKGAGFMLHMDDFGSGVSSLASLNVLPFDVLKLDKTLIDQIYDEGGVEIVRHTIELAHFKNMKVVAEGVETREQLEILKDLECDMIQGYLLGKPMPYEDTIEFFIKNLTERSTENEA